MTSRARACMVAKRGSPACKVWTAGTTKNSSPLACGHGAVNECRIGERNYAGTKRVNENQYFVEIGEAEPKRSNVK